MPRTYANCGPVVTARAGIEIPDPRTPRPDFDAIRARFAARAATLALVDVGQAPQVGAQPPVLLVDQDVDVAMATSVGPVVCDVCGVRVAGEYVARTGQTRHKPCQAKASTVCPAVREVA
jgi:hypothetical protein